MLAVKNISKLLADVPKGSRVALSRDEDKVIAYASELHDAIQKAKEAGENDPIVLRVPQTPSATLIL